MQCFQNISNTLQCYSVTVDSDCICLRIPCFFFIKDCNQFKSGEITDMLRSKGKNKLFDEKGVFGRVCRHEYPKGFLSIKHGER